MKTNKNTPNKGFKLDIKSFYEDWDNDGVINGVDCYPKDKSRQDAYTDFKNMAKTAGNVAVNLSKPYIRLATNPVAAVNQAGVGLNRLVTNPGKFSQTVVSNLTRSPTKTIISRPAPLRQADTVTKRFQSSLPSKTSWKPSITSRVSPGFSSNKIIRKTMPQSMKRLQTPPKTSWKPQNTGRTYYDGSSGGIKKYSPVVPTEYERKIKNNPSLYKQPGIRPKSWTERAPPLKTGVKPDYRNVFIKQSNLRDKKDIVDVGAGYTANPYYKSINRLPAKTIIKQKLLEPRQNQNGNVWIRDGNFNNPPKLSKGYKPDYASKTIPRQALADPDMRYGRGKQVVNPYYVPNPAARKTVKERVENYEKTGTWSE